MFEFVTGSNSRRKDGEGTSGIKRVEEEDDDNYEYEQHMNFMPSQILLDMQQVRNNYSFYFSISFSEEKLLIFV